MSSSSISGRNGALASCTLVRRPPLRRPQGIHRFVDPGPGDRQADCGGDRVLDRRQAPSVGRWLSLFRPHCDKAQELVVDAMLPSHRLQVAKDARLVQWLLCHRQVDTVITIFLECIFQVCIRKMSILNGGLLADVKRSRKAKYAEFLGLPLKFERRNPATRSASSCRAESTAVKCELESGSVLSAVVCTKHSFSGRQKGRNDYVS